MHTKFVFVGILDTKKVDDCSPTSWLLGCHKPMTKTATAILGDTDIECFGIYTPFGGNSEPFNSHIPYSQMVLITCYIVASAYSHWWNPHIPIGGSGEIRTHVLEWWLIRLHQFTSSLTNSLPDWWHLVATYTA